MRDEYEKRIGKLVKFYNTGAISDERNNTLGIVIGISYERFTNHYGDKKYFYNI